MKKINDTLYLDVNKITAVQITHMTTIGARETKTTIIVDGQKINVTKNEFELIRPLLKVDE